MCIRDRASSGHPGGSLSAVELMVGIYHVMRVDPKNPDDPMRDRFVLSKGHAAPCYYAILGEKGFFDVKEFGNFRQIHSMLQGQMCIRDRRTSLHMTALPWNCLHRTWGMA